MPPARVPRLRYEPEPEPAPLELVSPPPAPAGMFPSRRVLLDPSQPFLVPLVLLAATRGLFAWLLPFACEDAYITFRYARNLVLGFGLTYNPGERVMGFTSPLWTIWNAAGYALLRDPVLWSRAWSVTADVVTLLVMGHLLQRHASRAAAWCFTVFFALWTYFGAVAVSGMESSAMLALIVLGAALVERRHLATGPALAALALMRPEGLVAAGVLAVWARRRDRFVAGALAGGGIAALAWYYGSIVPQSVIAKSSIYGTPGPLAGRHWWEWLSPFAFGRWPVTTEGSILFAMAIVAAPAVVSGARALVRARSTGLAAAVSAAIVVWLGYCALGVAYFFWYLAVPLAGLAALACIGLPRLTKGPALYASLLVFVLGTWTVAPNLYLARSQAERYSFGATAEYLVHHSRAGQKVLLEPIGMVGYRCKLWVIDEVGLVSPQVSRRRLQGAGWMSDIIRSEHPDWIVIRRSELRDAKAFAGVGAPFRTLAERDAIIRDYDVATVVRDETGDQALEVLARRE